MLGGSCTKAHTAWMVATPLNLEQPSQHMLFWTLAVHGRLDQERQSKYSGNMHGILALRRNSAVVTNVSCLPTLLQKLARKVAISTFQQFHHVLHKVDVLETGDVPILLFPLSKMENLGTTIELDPKGRQNYMFQILVLYSSPAEHSTMGHVVLDLTNLACQPTTKSREQSGHPERRVTFAMSER